MDGLSYSKVAIQITRSGLQHYYAIYNTNAVKRRRSWPRLCLLDPIHRFQKRGRTLRALAVPLFGSQELPCECYGVRSSPHHNLTSSSNADSVMPIARRVKLVLKLVLIDGSRSDNLREMSGYNNNNNVGD